MMFRSLLLAISFVALAGASVAQDRGAVEAQFRTWLEQVIWPRAKGEGVSRHTFEAAFSGVRLNWKLPDLVPPGRSDAPPKKQRQAEFGSPGKYFNAGSVNGAVSVGRKMAGRYKSALSRAEKTTGVPGRIILAIWGRESGYGQVKIPHDAFEVLGTKGFMSRRAAYFSDELVAALQIVEASGLSARALKSSWAGALGQPQFMPSNYLKYGVDGDGDGRVDIWKSQADTIASIATYLARHGWVKGRDWGFEVRVPSRISCTLEGPDQGRKIRDWVDAGIERVSGRPFPDHELKGEGYLLMPAGRSGPAFIVTPNFYVLKEYNKSDLYALFVGHIGDKIQYGVGGFSAPWGKVGGLYRSDVALMQRGLEKRGHDVGGADGLPGFKTRRSIGRWQEKNGQAATCFPETYMRAALGK